VHIESTRHEHARSSKVHVYEADYEIRDDRIVWSADVSTVGEGSFRLNGEVPVTTPAMQGLAEQVVRDAIVARIDASGPAG
jgi:hypothetical protein